MWVDAELRPGCGKFFEGTGEEMHKALNVVLATLPDDTKVFVSYPSPHLAETGADESQPGHEYTKSNVRFALSVLQSDAVRNLEVFAEKNKETQGQFTIGDEKNHNVFMRPQVSKGFGVCGEGWVLTTEQDPEIQKATGETDPVAIMTKLREMKNSFK